jgi:hypothetical protein
MKKLLHEFGTGLEFWGRLACLLIIGALLVAVVFSSHLENIKDPDKRASIRYITDKVYSGQIELDNKTIDYSLKKGKKEYPEPYKDDDKYYELKVKDPNGSWYKMHIEYSKYTFVYFSFLPGDTEDWYEEKVRDKKDIGNLIRTVWCSDSKILENNKIPLGTTEDLKKMKGNYEKKGRCLFDFYFPKILENNGITEPLWFDNSKGAQSYETQ